MIYHVKYRALLEIYRALLTIYRALLNIYRALFTQYMARDTHTQYAIPPHFDADRMRVSRYDTSCKIQGSFENI